MSPEELEYYRDLIKNPSDKYMESVVQACTNEVIARKIGEKSDIAAYQRRMYKAKQKEYPTIYMILNDMTGDAYVGRTINPLSKRMAQHRSSAKQGRNNKIYQDMREWGVENFRITELYQCTENNDPDEKEQEQIILWGCELNTRIAKI